MNNKQLLIDAAKAAGYEVEWDGYQFWIQWPEYDTPSIWGPDESDADAFRLMVDCNIKVSNNEVLRQSFAYPHPLLPTEIVENWEDHDGDRRAASRMAITRAAAQSQERGDE
jgi:hypothetical protein